MQQKVVVTYRGKTHSFDNIYALSDFAWNTEKIDLCANVDETTVDITHAASELQKLYDDIEALERIERDALLDTFCDKELED